MSKYPDYEILTNAYMPCSSCRGYGLQDSIWRPTVDKLTVSLGVAEKLKNCEVGSE